MTDHTTPACRWVSSEQARVIPGRHEADCAGDCSGCQVCAEDHCLVCGKEHVPTVCVGCVGVTRADLYAIRTLFEHLGDEAEHRAYSGDRPGSVLGGDAMVMMAMRYGDQNGEAGAWHQHFNNSHESPADPMVPIIVLVGWEDCYRGVFGTPTKLTATVERSIVWLLDNLHMMAASLDVPFVDFVRDVSALRGRLEDVLHDGDREEFTRVRCNRCKARPQLLVKKGAAEDGAYDRWICPECEYRFTREEMLKAHAQQLRHEAAEKYVLRSDAVGTLRAQGRSEHTIRKWLEPPRASETDEIVGGYCDVVTRRVFVWWPDLWRRHLMTATRKRAA